MRLQLSQEVERLKRSVLRELLGLAVDPNIVSLAGGLPANENMPVELFRIYLNAVLDRDGAKAMQAKEGMPDIAQECRKENKHG